MKLCLAIITASLLASCTSGIRMTLKSDCGQGYRSVTAVPQPFHEIKINPELSGRFTFSSLNAANAIGILDDLTLFVSRKQQNNPTPEDRLAILELSQVISQRINMASLEVSAVASELDCEEESITQLAEYMKNKEGEAESRLTVAAIIAGASGAIASGIVLSNPHVSNNLEYVGIVSGIAEAGIGLLILTNKRKVTISHSKNTLQEIWDGKQSAASPFPPFVWYFLNYANPQTPEEKTIRMQLIERWKSFNGLDKPGVIQKYFGNGGKYSTDELLNRANMYDQLESSVKLIKQDLTVLAVELEHLK